MRRQDKKLFDERFNIFWERLTKKKKMSDEQKAYYQKTMSNHFNELMKNLDVHRALFYVFNIPISIINFNKATRKKRDVVKYFLKVIDYYLENETSIYKDEIWSLQNKRMTEVEACNYIFFKYQSELPKYKDDESFRSNFREWYQDIRNKDSFPQITEYLIALRRTLKNKASHSK